MASEDTSRCILCVELEEDLHVQIEESFDVNSTLRAAHDATATPNAGSSFNENNEDDNIKSADSKTALVDQITRNLIGRDCWFDSPFGTKKLQSYADFTASGKSLQMIEDYMQQEVLPLYGNTHTTSSITGLQSTCFRHEARQIIAQAVNAKITGRGAEDCVLFTGQGSSSAIKTLVMALGLHLPLQQNDARLRPVVFVGPFEHHANMLPWRESAADVVTIPENANGQVDLQVLQQHLQTYADRPLKIGSFTAASNLTGVLTDVHKITTLLHQHGALAFWDYATCAPYVDIDMNPVVSDENARAFVYKDAVFMSGHKFVGGPGSPGVLVVKKRLLGNQVPTLPAGGTVFFVTKDHHRYLSNRVEREEGGTPDILGSIRLGLAFELKQRIGTKRIMDLEHDHVRFVRDTLSVNKNIVLLGPQDPTIERLPIFSFLVRFGERFLHYNFVCALLNDLFGIQTRGGCQCAGPYAWRLLGMHPNDILAIENALVDRKELLVRPGLVRMSFPYFMSQSEMQYIVHAVDFVATYGWRFLPLYRFNHKTGVWKHWTRFTRFPDRKWLTKVDFFAPKASVASTQEVSEELRAAHWQENLVQAQRLATNVAFLTESNSSGVCQLGEVLDESHERLRWFVYPSEALALLKSTSEVGSIVCVTQETTLGPVQPQRYTIPDFAAASEQKQNEKQKKEAKAQAPNGTCCVPNGTRSPVGSTTSRASKSSSPTKQQTSKYPLRRAEDALSQKTNGVFFAHAQQATTQIAQKSLEVKLFPTVPKKLMRLVGQAVMQWQMIQDGDRLLLGVSGGKDSLSLLHILLALQKRAPIKFEIACATVDPQTPSFDPSPLKAYMNALNVPYFYLSENIIERATCEMTGDSICSYCSRMKRGLLYTCCRQQNFNKLVLAQHLDDLAESFLMSAIHNGQLRTMKAIYWNDQRDVQILRPLVYVRELLLKNFAYDARLPVINENCPACFEEPKERHRVKKMLAKEESLFPEMYNSIRRALLPLMNDSIYQPMQSIRQQIELQASKPKPKPKNLTKSQCPEANAEAKS